MEWTKLFKPPQLGYPDFSSCNHPLSQSPGVPEALLQARRSAGLYTLVVLSGITELGGGRA